MAGIQKLGGGIGPKQEVFSETEREEVLDNREEGGKVWNGHHGE